MHGLFACPPLVQSTHNNARHVSFFSRSTPCFGSTVVRLCGTLALRSRVFAMKENRGSGEFPCFFRVALLALEIRASDEFSLLFACSCVRLRDGRGREMYTERCDCERDERRRNARPARVLLRGALGRLVVRFCHAFRSIYTECSVQNRVQ